MKRAWFLAVSAGLFLPALGSAQTAPWRFLWQQGQVLHYRFEQVTSAAEVVDGKKSETTQKLNHVRRWQVAHVDATGVATLQMSLVGLRLETTTPTGEVILFDSNNPAKNNPQLQAQLSKFVGTTLAVLRIDNQGRLVEVKESKHGPASRFESELPFVLTLSDDGPKYGQSWERAYAITLEPPEGTGEKFHALQKYQCKGVQKGLATIGMTTVLRSPLPDALLDQVPLLQMQPEGEVVFDVGAGRLHSARLRVNKELTNHQGDGSSYRFQSTCTLEYVANP